MAVIALRCPTCNGDLEMEDSREFGFCQFCGTKVLIQKTVEQKLDFSFKFDESSKTGNLINLAFNEWKTGQNESAKEHIIKALEIDHSDSRGWMLRNIIEGRFDNPYEVNMKEGDLEFAIKIVNVELARKGGFQAPIGRWVINEYVSRFFPRDGISAFLGSLDEFSKNYSIAMQKYTKGVIRVRTDQLETGFESFCDEAVLSLQKLSETYNSLKGLKPFTIDDKSIVKFIEERVSFFSNMKNSTKSSFSVLMGRDSNAGMIAAPVHYFNGSEEKMKLKKGATERYELSVGGHIFIDGKKLTKLYLPKMPDTGVIGKQSFPVLLDGVTVPRSFMLINFPDWCVEIEYRP